MAPSPEDCHPRTLTEQCSACCTRTPRILSASSFRDGLPLCQGTARSHAGVEASAGGSPTEPRPRDLQCAFTGSARGT